MATPATLYEQTLTSRLLVYNAWLDAGKGTPFLYPWDTLVVGYLFLGIVVRPYLNPQLARTSGYAAFIAIVVHCAYIVSYRRSLGAAAGYGIGLTCIWGVIITGVLLLLHEPEKDFARLEVRKGVHATTYTQTPGGVAYSTGKEVVANNAKKRTEKDFTQKFEPADKKQSEPSNPYRLVWQPYPTGLWHIIDWTLDLMSTFRGPNWNFRITTLPKIQTIPPPAQYKTTKAIEASMLANEKQSPDNPASPGLLRQSITDTLMFYIIVDIHKLLMISDPYFLGLHSLASPSPWPYFRHHPFFTKFARLGISLGGVWSWLSLVFSLGPLFFYVVFPRILPQSALLKITKAPLYDPRMYSRLFGPLLPNIKTTGLVGFWGKFWHQFFRIGLSSPSRPIIKALKLNPRSQTARAIQSMVAFCISGLIHACGSATTFSIIRSKPFNAWLFFQLQAVGIIVQTFLAQFLTKTLKLKIPTVVRQVTNVVFVAIWLWQTGPLLADDFARCGVWLFEPCPVSPMLGLTGQGWWRWRDPWFATYKGNSIFSSGISVI